MRNGLFWPTLNDSQIDKKTLNSGQHLCRQGQPCKKLFIVQSGLLKSYLTKSNGDSFVMTFHLPSDLFGWEGIDKPKRNTSVIALTQSIVCSIEADELFKISENNTLLKQQLLSLISRRIHHDNLTLLRTSAQQRVATFILQLTARYRDLGYPNDRCQLLIPHQDIANYLRINPSTISRVFNKLQKDKIILLEKQMVYLLDIPKLRVLAEFDD